MKKNILNFIIVSGLLTFNGLGCQTSSQPTQSNSSLENLLSLSSSEQENEKIKQIEPLTILNEENLTSEQQIENNRIHQNILYFQILNNRYSSIYPTIKQYKYDFTSRQTTLLKERNVEENERVWDFFENENNLYESVLSFQDESILINGTPIWSAPLANALQAPTFSFQDGKIYFMASFFQQGQIISELYRIDNQNPELLWSSNQENDCSLIARSQTQDDYSPLVFESNSSIGKQIYFLKSDELQSVPFEKDIIRFESLKENIVLISRENAKNPQLMQYHLLNQETLEITPIFSTDSSIGALNAGGGTLNTFFFVNQNQGTSFARLNGDELISQSIDIPTGTSLYWTLNEKQNVIFVESYETIENEFFRHPQYFLLSWE